LEDKRKFKRFSIDLNAKYLLGGKRREWKGCSLINISREGIGIEVYLRERIRIGTTLEIEIIVPAKEKPIKAMGILMWIKKLKEKIDFVGGIKLIKIDSEDKWTLLDYAFDNLSRKEKHP
jgi:hypothetical protein